LKCCTKRRQLAVRRLGAAPLAEAHLALADADPPAVGFFEQIDAAQQCRFSGAARADDRDDRAAFDPQRHPLQHLHCAERFPEIGDLDHVA
jgi:hypothetical protein